MSTPNPSPLQDEKARFQTIQAAISLKEITEALDETERLIAALPGKLNEIRAQGYGFKPALESQVADLSQRWIMQRDYVRGELLARQRSFQNEAAQINLIHSRGALAGAALNGLESKIADTARSLKASYTPLQDESGQIERQLEDISWTMQQAGQISFAYEAGEQVAEAVPANWKKADDKDGVDGVLFLTNLRLIFEQKEEVATKKMLFITTAKQKLQSLQWALPVDQITAVQSSKRGFLNKDDFLTITCSGAPFTSTDLHLKGESGETWSGYITAARSGNLGAEPLVTTDVPVETRTEKWGMAMPISLPSAEGIIQVRAYGDYIVSGAASSEVEQYLRQKLQSYLTDLLGENASAEASFDMLRALKDQFAQQMCQRAQADFANQGLALAYVHIAEMQRL